MKKELESTALGNVAGGQVQVVETKDGNWMVVPSFCKTFATKEEAEKLESEIKENLGSETQGHHGPHGHHDPRGPQGGNEPATPW